MANKQPLKKKEVKGLAGKRTLQDFKQSNGYTYNNADKPIEWIVMPAGYQSACRLSGIPCGYSISLLGFPSVGKSTLINHAAAAAQKQGIIPVIIDTENAFSFKYAMDMGLEAEPVYEDVEYVDEETGEVTIQHEITHYDGDFFYFNNHILAERYGDNDYATGKKSSKKRKIAVIEDVAQCVNDLLDAQEDGDLPFPLLFLWDSVSSIGSFQEYASGKKANNLWTAGAISTSMREIFDNRIPGSRKVTSKYTNTFMYVQKLSVSTTPNGLPVAKGKGGLQLFYSARLQLFLGGVASQGTKVLSVISKGVQFDYAIETKIKVTKNQLPSPYNITGEGKFVCTHQGIIRCEDAEEYKKNHLPEMLKELNRMLAEQGKESVSEKDIEFVETDTSEE